MKVRAVAIASDRSNAIGTVELECTPHGLVVVHLGVGAFSEDYAPAALTSGTRVLVPWAAVDEATIDEQLQMNSLTFVELQVAIEDEYGIELDAVHVVELNRFDSIVDYVWELAAGAAR